MAIRMTVTMTVDSDDGFTRASRDELAYRLRRFADALVFTGDYLDSDGRELPPFKPATLKTPIVQHGMVVGTCKLQELGPDTLDVAFHKDLQRFADERTARGKTA